MLLLTIPITILWTFATPILIYFGQDLEISNLAGNFIKALIPGLFPFLLSDCIRRYLQAQKIANPAMYITLIAFPLNILLQYLLVFSRYSIGPIGAPVTTSIVNTLTALIFIAYVWYFGGGKCYSGWEWREALDTRKLQSFIRLGSSMYFLEWRAYEMIALSAGKRKIYLMRKEFLAINTLPRKQYSSTFLYFFIFLTLLFRLQRRQGSGIH